MADFLASFNFDTATPQANNVQLASVDDLKSHLAGILNAKVTATRTEHVAITVELRATVQLTLQLSESENHALTGLAGIDPLPGGAASVSIDIEQADDHILRTVKVHDALTNQPQDDPALQRVIAKHVIDAIGATDQSAWTVREVSRASQGWSFTYICKDSLQMWTRQTSKSRAIPVIGEYSYKDADPVLMNRPAFDCRGSITISFSRTSRSLVISYNHTPVHKTVGDLAQHYKPPHKELGPGAQKQKTPKKPSGPAKKVSTGEQGGPSRSKKRSKKNNGEAQASAPECSGTVAGDPGTQPNATGEQQQSSAPPTAPPSMSVAINVSPAEAARRREAATAMLTNAGVDPNSLSTEQFNIFANQSPDLQKESLIMLVKYGAERLRIVHPGNADAQNSATSTSSTPVQASQPSSSGPTTTDELVPQTQTPEDGTLATTTAETLAPSQATPSTKRKMGKSRVACLQCKRFKVKCPHEKPTCGECEKAGLPCEYPPLKPRKKKNLSEAIVQDDAEGDEIEVEQQIQQEQMEQGQSHQDEAQDHQAQTLDYQQGYEQQSHATDDGAGMNVTGYEHQPYTSADSVVPLAAEAPLPVQQQPQPAYFQSASGLALPRQEAASLLHLAESATSSITAPDSQGFRAINPQLQQHTPSPRLSQSAAETKSKRAARKPLAGSPRKQRATAEQIPTRCPAVLHQPVQPAQPPQNMVGRGTSDQSAGSSVRNAPPPRSRSRQGQSTQSHVPVADPLAVGSYQQATPSQQARRTSVQHSHPNPAPTAGYGQQGHHSASSNPSNDHASERIAYVPYAQQQRRDNTPYNHQRHSQDTSPALNTVTAESIHSNAAAVAQPSQPGQWSGIQGRDTHTQQGHALYNTPTSFSQPSAPDSSSVRDYHRRAANTQAMRLEQARADSQQTQSPYQQLPQSQPQPQQQGAQRHGWYTFGGDANQQQQQYASLGQHPSQTPNQQNRRVGWKLPDGSVWTDQA